MLISSLKNTNPIKAIAPNKDSATKSKSFTSVETAESQAERLLESNMSMKMSLKNNHQKTNNKKHNNNIKYNIISTWKQSQYNQNKYKNHIIDITFIGISFKKIS